MSPSAPVYMILLHIHVAVCVMLAQWVSVEQLQSAESHDVALVVVRKVLRNMQARVGAIRLWEMVTSKKIQLYTLQGTLNAGTKVSFLF